MSKPRTPALFGIFLTVLLDMLSFGLAITDIQIRGAALVKSAGYYPEGVIIGLLIASFSIAQFIAGPYLGRLSDFIGRRPILLATCFMVIIGHFTYAFAEVFWIMLLARVLGGLGSANLSVAFAYVSDITTPENRAKGMGMVGAAFGIGFLIGAPAGAFLLELGGGHPHILGYTGAALAAINFLYIAFLLPESLKKNDDPAPKPKQTTWSTLSAAYTNPQLAILLSVFFTTNFAFANLETTYMRLTDESFKLTQVQASFLLVLVGAVSAATQGLLVKPFTARFGEIRILRFAYFMQAPMLALIPFAPPWIPQIIGIMILGTVTGLSQPSMSSLISKTAPPEMQGGIFGVTQSLGSVARIIAPVIGNALFSIAAWVPYAFAGGIMLIPAIGTLKIREPEPTDSDQTPIPAH
ncbi:MAG: MFS transporter [Fimbriimonadaceae bacterium]|nr:MFS transporter [Fimbriimonadaceae bacterium]